MKRTHALVLLGITVGPVTSTPAISLTDQNTSYAQDFNSLATSGTGNAWSNDSTLPGWHLIRQGNPNFAASTYSAGTGSSSSGNFYSYGSSGSTDRALGSVGSSSVSGWIAASLINNSSTVFTGFSALWNGEQWRNAGNTSAQTMVFQYGFGSSFDGVSDWTTPGGNFDFASPLHTSSAGAVNGNTLGLTQGLGGEITGLNWTPGTTLWLRWIEQNDAGNDHGLAIDDFSFSAKPAIASAASTVPDGLPGGWSSSALIGILFLGAAGIRRSERSEAR